MARASTVARATVATITPSASPFSSMTVFDRAAKLAQRERALSRPDAERFDYLRDEVACRVADRLDDITRNFDRALDLGCGAGHMLGALAANRPGLASADGSLRGGIRCLTQLGASTAALARTEARARDFGLRCDTLAAGGADSGGGGGGNGGGVALECVQADEEQLQGALALGRRYDLVMSSMSLHWVNDLPGTLIQAAECLEPDGVFIGAMLGGGTLSELRSALVVAEQEREGGVSAHVSPFAQLADIGQLMQRAGFALPTVDTDVIRLDFPDAFLLMEHLGAMGEGNACLARRPAVPRDTLVAAAEAYHALYGNEDGTVPATFQVVHMLGWKPHPSQAQPKARGSAQRSLKELEVHSSSSGGGGGGGGGGSGGSGDR
eukprot:g6833.t1